MIDYVSMIVRESLLLMIIHIFLMIITTVKKVELSKEKTKFKAFGLNLVSV